MIVDIRKDLISITKDIRSLATVMSGFAADPVMVSSSDSLFRVAGALEDWSNEMDGGEYELIGTKEIAEATGVSRRVVQRMCKDSGGIYGVMATRDSRGAYRWFRKDLRKIVERVKFGKLESLK